MENSVLRCPYSAEPGQELPDNKNSTDISTSYSVLGGPKGKGMFGLLLPLSRNPLGTLMDNALNYGDIIPFRVLGQDFLQLNHPDVIRYVLMENNKNYYKSRAYVRFESAIGQGLLTSNGEKWRRDRQKIQPMFRREQLEGLYFDTMNAVSEEAKARWLAKTTNGPATINVIEEMAEITIRVILRILFGNNLDDRTANTIRSCYITLMRYLDPERIFPHTDIESYLHTPRYMRFSRALEQVTAIIRQLLAEKEPEMLADKYNMLALLLEARKNMPEHFTDKHIMEHFLGMIFAGFETTSVVMQWMFYELDERPEIVDKLRTHITEHAPYVLSGNSRDLNIADVNKMDYLSAVFHETLRLNPPLFATSREPINDDLYGNFFVKKHTIIVLPQMIMQRHPRYWKNPNAFIPERFLQTPADTLHPGLYFPFSNGPRKCTGNKFSELEVKVVFSKLLPLFDFRILNRLGNNVDHRGITLKLDQPLQAEIRRI